jgi:hypothetical protein
MRQVAAQRGGQPAWIRFTVDHERTFDARLGYCVDLNEGDDGAHGAFRLYAGAQLGKVRDMLSTSHNGLSVEFTDIATPVIDGPLRRRRQINMLAVTATPVPVYDDARVLSIRAEDNPLAVAGTPNLDQVRAMLAETAD